MASFPPSLTLLLSLLFNDPIYNIQHRLFFPAFILEHSALMGLPAFPFKATDPKLTTPLNFSPKKLSEYIF